MTNLKENIIDSENLIALSDTIINFVVDKCVSFAKQRLHSGIFTTLFRNQIKFAFNEIEPPYSLRKFHSEFLDMNFIFRDDSKHEFYYKQRTSFPQTSPKIKISFPSPEQYEGYYKAQIDNPDMPDWILKSHLKFILEKTIKEPLAHEIQHAYDDYRSKGLIFQTKQAKQYFQKYYKKRDDMESLEKYLNQPHEIWARITQFILKYKDNLKDYNTYPEFAKEIKTNFKGYGTLPTKTKKRIFKTLYIFWKYGQDPKTFYPDLYTARRHELGMI